MVLGVHLFDPHGDQLHPLNRKGFILPRQTWCSLSERNCVTADRQTLRNHSLTAGWEFVDIL